MVNKLGNVALSFDRFPIQLHNKEAGSWQLSQDQRKEYHWEFFVYLNQKIICFDNLETKQFASM